MLIIIQVLNSLKAGNESLKEVHKLFSIEDIEQIMDETREGIEKQKVPNFIQFVLITPFNISFNISFNINFIFNSITWISFQEIDDILAGALTAEDEEAVDLEFAEIIKQNLPDVPAFDSNISEIELPSIPMEEPKPKKEKISRDPVPLLAWFFVIICLIWVM